MMATMMMYCSETTTTTATSLRTTLHRATPNNWTTRNCNQRARTSHPRRTTSGQRRPSKNSWIALDYTIVQYTIIAVNHRAQTTCVEINHPSQVHHQVRCFADSYDITTKHLSHVLDAALSIILAKWATCTWREELKEKVTGEQKPPSSGIVITIRAMPCTVK